MEQAVGGMRVSPEEASEFRSMFDQLKGEVGGEGPGLSPSGVAVFMRRFNLSKENLQRIWRVCVGGSGEVTRAEFYGILKLIKAVQEGLDPTPENGSLTSGVPRIGEAVPPAISEAELRQIEDFLASFPDPPSEGLSREKWEPLCSKLDRHNLDKLWGLFSLHGPTLALSRSQLIASLSIASRFLQGRPIPDSLDTRWTEFIKTYRKKPGRTQVTQAAQGTHQESHHGTHQGTHKGTHQSTQQGSHSEMLVRVLASVSRQEENFARLSASLKGEHVSEGRLSEVVAGMQALARMAESEHLQLATISDAVKMLLDGSRRALEARRARARGLRQAAEIVASLETKLRTKAESSDIFQPEEPALRKLQSGNASVGSEDTEPRLQAPEEGLLDGGSINIEDQQNFPGLSPLLIDDPMPLKTPDVISMSSIKDITGRLKEDRLSDRKSASFRFAQTSIHPHEDINGEIFNDPPRPVPIMPDFSPTANSRATPSFENPEETPKVPDPIQQIPKTPAPTEPTPEVSPFDNDLSSELPASAHSTDYYSNQVALDEGNRFSFHTEEHREDRSHPCFATADSTEPIILDIYAPEEINHETHEATSSQTT